MIYTSDICIDNYRNIQSIQKTIDTFKTEYQVSVDDYEDKRV
jgi:hypothetical protein